jgi:hypothetical protein
MYSVRSNTTILVVRCTRPLHTCTACLSPLSFVHARLSTRILMCHSFPHSVLYYQVPQATPETKVWLNWCLLAWADHYGDQFRSLHDLHSLKLRPERQRRRYAYCPTFSCSRRHSTDLTTAVMCTAEMCTSLIVASLPGLKVLITRTIVNHSSSRSGSGYNKSSDTPQSHSRIAKISARLSRPLRRASVDDSEFELIAVAPSEKQYNGKLAPSVGSVSMEDTQITVKHDFSVEHGVDSKRGSYQNTTSMPFV